MNSLTPFIRHLPQDPPGTSGAPGASSSSVSPPLGSPPPDRMPEPVPPTPEPAPPAVGVPVTDGTPLPCRQKNARDFLAGDVQVSVMTHYAPGLFSTEQRLYSKEPAPEKDPAAVEELTRWREDAPYG